MSALLNAFHLLRFKENPSAPHHKRLGESSTRGFQAAPARRHTPAVSAEAGEAGPNAGGCTQPHPAQLSARSSAGRCNSQTIYCHSLQPKPSSSLTLPAPAERGQPFPFLPTHTGQKRCPGGFPTPPLLTTNTLAGAESCQTPVAGHWLSALCSNICTTYHTTQFRVYSAPLGHTHTNANQRGAGR